MRINVAEFSSSDGISGEEVTKTVGDVFDDIGDFLDGGGSGGDEGAFDLYIHPKRRGLGKR